MAFLCISADRSSDDVIILKEGKLYEIDRETVKYIDSDEIRKKYKKKFAEFQNRFPNAGRGYIRIFNESTKSENSLPVLYKKHHIGFKEIIRNRDFMSYLCKAEYAKLKEAERAGKPQEVYIEEYERIGVLYKNFDNSVNRILKILRSRDKDKDGISTGGKKYFGFVRLALLKYEYYIEYKNRDLPSIEKIYKNHIATLDTKPKRTVHEQTITDFTGMEDDDYIPKNIITEKDFIDIPNYENLMYPETSPYSFFESEHFDRHFYSMFEYSHISILGDSKDSEDYQNIYDISDRCFNGDICCPMLGKRYDLYDEFNKSIMNIFYCTKKDKEIEKSVARSLINNVPTIIVTNDLETLDFYKEKYPDIKTIYSQMDNDEYVRELIEVFIELYNTEYKKGNMK